MDNMQGAPCAPGATGDPENPEMSRRGAFAAGGLAFAALVAGGCGWLAMNSKEPSREKLLVTSLSSKNLTKNVALTAATDNEAELNGLGLSRFQTSFGERDTIKALDEVEARQMENPVYATFSFSRLSAGSPYLLRATVFRPTFELVEDAELYPSGWKFAKVANGQPYRISSTEAVGTYSVVCVPSSADGMLSIPLSIYDDSDDLYAKGSMTYMGQC